jgi:hypothetical protein
MSKPSPFRFPRCKSGFTRGDDGSKYNDKARCPGGCGPVFSTISTHFCSQCGAAFDYWLGETNQIWRDAQAAKALRDEWNEHCDRIAREQAMAEEFNEAFR